MAIAKRIIKCDCGEEFETDVTGSELKGNLLEGAWKFIRALGMDNPNGNEIVKVLFKRQVDCGKCFSNLTTQEKIGYIQVSEAEKLQDVS